MEKINKEYNLDEIAEEVYAEMAADEMIRIDTLKSNLEIFKSKIDYAEYHFEDYIDENELSYNEHIGYVDVSKIKVGDKTRYVVVGEDNIYYTIQDTSFAHNFHVLVYQTVGYCEDDYSGFILLPMKDGKYWKIRYWS